MGSNSSKFRKHLQNGDEYAALQLYYSSSDLRKGLDPNSSYGDTYSHDTPLHYAARHAMKSLLRVFLMELGGNPNKKNARNESSLQSVCMVSNARLNYAIQQRRLECLSLVLQWRGATLENGEVERVDLSAQDEKMNTALHYAAASGLKRCVEMLVSQNAPLFTDNTQKLTPCDCAEKCGHNEIALYLESKMVFSNEDDSSDDMEDLLTNIDDEEGYSGLRAQDLQEAKDQLLVETSDMLHVPLFTAEALLRNHEWSREMLLEAWMDDPVTCCEKCRVPVPSSVLEERPSTSTQSPPTGLEVELEHDLRTPTHTAPPTNDAICDICACMIPLAEEPVAMLCEHQFCRSCWERYLTVKIQEGETHNITCPGFDCLKLVPAEIIETLVSRDMARRYLQFDIKAFVESNPSIKWCPSPGCGRAVRLPDSENPLSPSFSRNVDPMMASDTSHAVDCGSGHLFCWECLGEAHEPACCENWTAWHKKIGEIKPEEMNGTEEETEMAANCLWLVTNSKPCPNCKSPIQKNEGCNHMKCSKCKHDFCWVCQEGWKKHSSATGGYFRCNRYEVVKRVEDGQDNAKTDAESKNKKMQELNRFVHYYTRFKNHENSFKLEEPLLSTAKDKMMVLAKAVTDPETANLETKFVEEAVVQILKSRRVLKCSYVYGYYLEETGYKKPIFEFMQTELEECTETLSEMVARPYLRTPRSKIIQTAYLVQRKRQEFVTAIAKGLVPPDTSPTLKKKRKKFSVEVDDDLRKALLASMQDLDPANPWIKDASGKHTNVSALLDWPEESDESDTELSPQSSHMSIPNSGTPSRNTGPDTEETNDEVEEPSVLEVLPPEPCVRAGCSRLRASNPRTGDLHDHCSMKCMRLDRMEKAEGSKPEPLAEFFTDYQMDLLRALEMSRLQFLQEMGSLRPGSGDRSPRSPIPSTSRRASSRSDLDVEADRSPQGASPIIPHSPRFGTSADMELSIPSIVLCDPPPGKNRPITGENTKGVESLSDKEPGEVMAFDLNLEHALRLSQIALSDEEQDLKLAIELSLRDSHKEPGAKPESPTIPAQTQSCPTTAGLCSRDSNTDNTRTPSAENHSLFSSEYSTIVTRVPNKSIEDLAIVEGGLMPYQSGAQSSSELCGGLRDIGEPASPHRITLGPNQIYFPGRVQEPDQIRFQGPKYHFLENVRKGQGQISPGQSNAKHPSGGRLSPRLQNPCGLMKDISVNNIVASDMDKTKEFLDKDFSQGFVKKSICDADIEAVVFEPRPCPSLVGRPPHWHLTQPTRHWSKPLDYAYEPGEDPWLRHSDLQHSSGPPAHSSHGGGVSPRHSYPRSASHLHSSTHSHSAISSKPQSAEQTSRILNPEESLDHALQNLNDLTRNLTRDDSIDSVDMVIDSKVLESLLQGAEGYAKDMEGANTPHPVEASLTEEPEPLQITEASDETQNQSTSSTEDIPLTLQLNEPVGPTSEPEMDNNCTEQDRDAVYV